MATSHTGYFIEEAARLARLSREMVDYLCRTEVLIPTVPGARGRGRRRLYSFGDIVMLRALAKLLERGVSVKALRHSLQALRQHHKDITPTSLPAAMLFTDGRVIYFGTKKEVLEELVSGQFAFAFVLELRGLQREVEKASKGIPKVKTVALGT